MGLAFNLEVTCTCNFSLLPSCRLMENPQYYCNEKNHCNNIRVIAIVDAKCCNRF